MALTFPPPLSETLISLRVYATGSTTGSWSDTKYVFAHPTRSDVQAWSRAIRITAGATYDLYFSFDGQNAHGIVKANSTAEYLERCEGGIAILGIGSSFTGEVVGAGDGVTTAFAHTAAHIPVVNNGSFLLHYTIGGFAKTATADFSGKITGFGLNSSLTNTINYTTGVVTLNFAVLTPPDNLTNITMDYKQGGGSYTLEVW